MCNCNIDCCDCRVILIFQLIAMIMGEIMNLKLNFSLAFKGPFFRLLIILTIILIKIMT